MIAKHRVVILHDKRLEYSSQAFMKQNIFVVASLDYTKMVSRDFCTRWRFYGDYNKGLAPNSGL